MSTNPWPNPARTPRTRGNRANTANIEHSESLHIRGTLTPLDFLHVVLLQLFFWGGSWSSKQRIRGLRLRTQDRILPPLLRCASVFNNKPNHLHGTNMLNTSGPHGGPPLLRGLHLPSAYLTRRGWSGTARTVRCGGWEPRLRPPEVHNAREHSLWESVRLSKDWSDEGRGPDERELPEHFSQSKYSRTGLLGFS